MQNYSAVLTAILTSLKHPTSIAAFASVGMHAVLGVALPSLPLFANGPVVGDMPTTQNQIGMVELDTQDAINRLPLNVIAPTPSANGWDNGSWDNSGFGLPSPSLSNLPDDSQFKADQFTGNITGNITGNPFAPAGQPAKPTPSQRGTSRVFSSNNTQPTQQHVPSQAVVAAARNQQRTQKKNVATPPDNLQSVPENQRRTPSRLELFPHLRFGTETFRRLDTLESLAEPQTRDFNPDAQKGPVAIAPQTVTPPEWSDDPHVRIQEQQDALRTQTTDTTQAEADENNARWLATLGSAKPQEYSIIGSYPQEACLLRLSGTSSYGATVQNNGAVGGVQLIRSSGHRIFDRQAEAVVRGFDFNNVTRPTPFKFNITFNYSSDNCPAQLDALSTPTPTVQPSPSPTPEAAPQPSPMPEAAPSASELLPETNPTPASEAAADVEAEGGAGTGAE
ncbi:MAG: TonB family protein [Cyanobacteria bacterium P01_G01_bin.54]